MSNKKKQHNLGVYIRHPGEDLVMEHFLNETPHNPSKYDYDVPMQICQWKQMYLSNEWGW